MAPFTKAVYRMIRHHPWTEWAQARLRRSSAMKFEEIAVCLDIAPGDILIDGGANIGDITSRMARTGATIYAFEPNPMCYDITRRRFACLPQVEVINKGIMDREGVLELRTPKASGRFDPIESSVSSSFVNPFDDASNDGLESVEIACEDICAWIERLASSVRLLKLDVEGAEIAIINKLIDTGAMDKVEFIVAETHERFSPELSAETEALRSRLAREGLAEKVRLDWC